MNNTCKKTLASILSIAMLATGTILLSSCKSNTTTASDTVVLTADAGATTTAPVVLPSVAAGTITIAGKTISAAEYDFNYYMVYNYQFMQYASYGMVPTVAAGSGYDLSTACALSGFENITWGEYIKKAAVKQLEETFILNQHANTEGMKLSASNQKQIDTFYTKTQTEADTYKLTFDQFLTTMYGDKMTKTEFDRIISEFLLAAQYKARLIADYTYTDAELQTYYTENKDNYKNIDLPTVRHILYLAPTGVDGYTDATQAELATAKAKADATLAKIKTYDDMVTIGDAEYADGAAMEAAEYAVATGAMVPEFETWSYDTARKPGDTAIIKTEYGYHVMYFVRTEKDWMADAKSKISSDKFEAYITQQETLPQFKMIQS